MPAPKVLVFLWGKARAQPAEIGGGGDGGGGLDTGGGPRGRRHPGGIGTNTGGGAPGVLPLGEVREEALGFTRYTHTHITHTHTL